LCRTSKNEQQACFIHRSLNYHNKIVVVLRFKKRKKVEYILNNFLLIYHNISNLGPTMNFKHF
jgi:hypothetical protein